MENEWIIIEEKGYPEQDGEYMVKMHTGSMRPRVIEMKSHFFSKDFDRHRFQGERGWNYAIAWRPLNDKDL